MNASRQKKWKQFISKRKISIAVNDRKCQLWYNSSLGQNSLISSSLSSSLWDMPGYFDLDDITITTFTFDHIYIFLLECIIQTLAYKYISTFV